MKYLFTVEDVFQISGRGCVVVPGVSFVENWKIYIGDKLTLKLPDGSTLTTQVAGIDTAGYKLQALPVLLGKEVSKNMVPVGTEIWVEDSVWGRINICIFGEDFRELIEHAKLYLAGNSNLAVLNGVILQMKGRLGQTDSPEIIEILADWERMINRRWNEWGLAKEPLSEEEFLDWLRRQVS